MSQKSVWLSYDLGIQGDYESLYQWLDAREALECGDSLAYVQIEPVAGASIPDQIKKSLEGVIKPDSKARIYILWRSADGKIKGKFIFGQRKSAPWTGYAPKPATEEVEG